MNILKQDEVDELYGLPVFSRAEREEYFSLDQTTLQYIRKLRKLETKIHFILYLGYFRSKPVIPHFHIDEVKSDIKYICRTYFAKQKPSMAELPKASRSRLVQQVLKQNEFFQLDQETTRELLARLEDVATIYADPKYMFDEALAYFGQKRIALPAYSSLQDLISRALSSERKRTERMIKAHLPNDTVQDLQDIMNDNGLLNSLSEYKGSARGFTPAELERELSTHRRLKNVYPCLKSLVQELKLSRGNMLYYSTLVKHRSTYKLRRTPKWQAILYLSCYLFFRYREINDRLVTAFCHLVSKSYDAAKVHAQQSVAKDIEVIREKLKYAGNVLNLFVDESVADAVPFGEIRQKAFSIIEESDLTKISKHLGDKDLDLRGYHWLFIDSQVNKSNKLSRKLFLAMDIDVERHQSMLQNQIVSAKSELTITRRLETASRPIIRPKDLPYLVKNDEVDMNRFEFYLYHRIVKMLESGKVYVSESEKNKRLADDLIPDSTWQSDQSDIIDKTGQEKLKSPISQTLSESETRLNELLDKVILNIRSDANDFVKYQPRSNRLTWSLANKRWKTSVDNPIYGQLPHKSIIEVMRYASRKTQFLSAFNSVSSRKKNMEARDEDLIACIFGNGANYGLHRMASISDRSVGALRSVNDSYLRPETTHAANDLVSNAIASLPIFKYYTINEASPFGSIDGQKHACRINTFKARFSAKYFRQGRGVSALTLVVNHVPVNTKVNAPNEYEGHFAFDLLYNNGSDIKAKSISTDTHGVNNVNFALLDLFGYQFAPRYARFKRIFEDLFNVEFDKELTISLKKPIKNKLIMDEWPNIQHIACSLSRKTADQSTIIKKLSNRKRHSRTLAALREYDRLIKCIYVLEYADDKTLRQFVQQALNRGEAYHQLRRAIASVNGNQFRGGTDYQIEQWNDCARLIANCIIYYNSALLSGLIEKFDELDNKDAVDMLANLSPVAWGHIQLSGNYTFAEESTLNLDSLLEDVNPLVGPSENDDY